MRWLITHAALVPLCLVVGVFYSCKHPSSADPTECDTCNNTSIDTTSHNFIWTQYLNVGNENNMTGCWVFGPNCILANNSYMYEWNGSTWQRLNLYSPDPTIEKNINGSLSGFSIFGFDTSDYWLTDASIIFHYTGNGIAPTYREENIVSGYPKWLHSAWGTSSSDMYFVGDSGTILHFDGTNWTRMSTPTTNSLGSIWGTSDNDIWADGFNPQTAVSELLHYNGNAWSEINLQNIGNIGPGVDGVGSVWEIDSASHKIVYIGGSHVWHSKDNGAWESDSGQVTNSVGGGEYIGIFGINGNSANDFMVAGDGGFISHWNGLSWHRYDTLYNGGALDYVTNAFSMKGNTVCAVGIKGSTSWIVVGQR